MSRHLLPSAVLAAVLVGLGCASERPAMSDGSSVQQEEVIVKGMAMERVRQILQRNGFRVEDYLDASAGPRDRPARKFVIESAGTPDALVLFGWSERFQQKKLREIYWHLNHASDGGPKAFRQNRREEVERVSVAEIKRRLKVGSGYAARQE